MLTPVDIQQKKFHMGIGYDKKDVNDFFKEVLESYEQLYRSNAALKEQVNTLNDGLQNYKSKEAALEKSLMLAEKDSEDTKSRAAKEAKTIELEAKNKAKIIIGDAEERLEQIKLEMEQIKTEYAAYKSNFSSLLKMQFNFLKENDFDVDSYIDDRALSLLPGGGAPVSKQSSGGDSFGSFTGDPQMRDESTLGGSSAGQRYNEYGEDTRTSTSAVYTSGLAEGDNFVDPFNPDKKDDGRYNPYDGRTVTNKKAATSFKVSNGKKTPRKPEPPKKNTSSKSPQQTKTEQSSSFSTRQSTSANSAKAAPKKPAEEPKKPVDEPKKPDTSSAKPEEVKEEKIMNEAVNNTAEEEKIPTIETEVGDVEEAPLKNDTALLSDGEEPNENEDDDGFEFV